MNDVIASPKNAAHNTHKQQAAAASKLHHRQTKTVKAPHAVQAAHVMTFDDEAKINVKESSAQAAHNTDPHEAVTAHQPRQNGVEAKAHKPEHAKTLMRRSVHKPQMTIKPAIKVAPPAEVAAAPLSAITVKRSALQVDDSRLERAKAIGRHAGVRRFMPANFSPAVIAVTPQLTPEKIPLITVKQAPAAKPVRHDIFEAAIATAQSHKQPQHKAVHRAHRRRLVNWSAGVAAFVLLAGFIAYLNMPNIELHIASFQAGFNATMPGTKPAGYTLAGGVQRSGNTVSLQYHYGENLFTITQQASDWNSQTLADNTIGLADGKYKTVEAAGRTVYLYGDNSATWVNGGVRYDLHANNTLSTGDITGLASSM